ncbi:MULTISPECIES: hypothetical protein [Paracoccaceae]|uniref:Uncharacterized protein n=1 Tax=Psychromarinibacter halotolerans TaxID=1775175 RepID=A0ABV7GIN3_9RHOB|nr:hypothetical protein [Psychromarinibacter halotolerans]MDF0599055.1 hypothetical protein [Psychromarinibacter halotolerans]
MQPTPGSDTPYILANHCRWERYSEIVPNPLRPCFRSFVLGTATANNAAGMPGLYRLA